MHLPVGSIATVIDWGGIAARKFCGSNRLVSESPNNPGINSGANLDRPRPRG
jgi:hypothetical protein